MGDIGLGYGSKWHLLRYLGWHRSELERLSLGAIPGAEKVGWVDFPFDSKTKPSGDAEWQSLDYLGEGRKSVQDKWRNVWPHGRGIQTWDAVGRVHVGSAQEWLLVEAKAHLGEMKSDCKAGGGLTRIAEVLDATKAALGVAPDRDWLSGYYQYANRIAALHFLIQQEVPARLLFIYFVGDSHAGCLCPEDESGWQPVLDAQRVHIGLPKGHNLEGRMHRLFVQVSPPSSNMGSKD